MLLHWNSLMPTLTVGAIITSQILNSNNQVVLNGTHTGGPVSIHPYCLVDDCYTFQVVGFGGGAGQIGWTLFDDEGNELFTGTCQR